MRIYKCCFLFCVFLFAVMGLSNAQQKTTHFKLYNEQSSTITKNERFLKSAVVDFIDSFDWRNRHGINWDTSVKHQGSGGGCRAFATVSETELYVNLYYNQKLDLDLSEQDVTVTVFMQAHKVTVQNDGRSASGEECFAFKCFEPTGSGYETDDIDGIKNTH